LSQASAEADAVKQTALASLQQELATGAAAAMAEAETGWQRTIAEREVALQGEKQLELETAEQEHSKQLATLGRKLADTETELSGARERENLNAERIMELESKLEEIDASFAAAKAQLGEAQETGARLQSELGETREARDGLQEALDTSRTKVEVLEGNKRDLDSRVGALEASKSQLESQLSMAVEKIATDEALLQRVRKAMAIGLSLLEEQERNAYGSAGSATEDEIEIESVSEDAE
jgi:chromosome segregation ATPase